MTANDPSTPAAPVVDGDPKDAEIRALANQLHRIIDEEDCLDEHVTAAHVAELIVNVDNMLEETRRSQAGAVAELAKVRASREAWAIEAMGLDAVADNVLGCYSRLCDAVAKAAKLPPGPSVDDLIEAVERLTRERDEARASYWEVKETLESLKCERGVDL